MIGSVRALAVLAIIAVAVVVVAIVAPRARPEVVDRRIAPGFATASLRTLRWQHGDRIDAEIVLGADGWQFPRGPHADTGGVDEVIAALRGGVWQRREPAARAGTIHERITAIGATTVTLGIGEALGDQVWLVAGDDALLVDGWIAHALGKGSDPPLGLRIRDPLAGAAEAERIDITRDDLRLALVGHPRRLGNIVVDAERVRALESALAGLTLTSAFRDNPVADHDHTSVAIGVPVAITIAAAGHDRCGEWITGIDGCVAGAAWAAAGAAITALAKPATEIAEPRPSPIDPVSIQLPDGTIDLDKRPTVDHHDADVARVGELVAALAAPATIVPAPSTTPSRTIVIRDRASRTIELELHDGIVVRRGEPVGLRLAPGAWATLIRPAASYRDTALWLEEPTSITAITVDGVTYRSGTIVGAWTRQPPGALDPAAIDAAARTLASPRAPATTLPATFAVQHRIAIVISAPSGPPVTHVLEIGAACLAKADGAAVTLPAPLCTLVNLGT